MTFFAWPRFNFPRRRVFRKLRGGRMMSYAVSRRFQWRRGVDKRGDMIGRSALLSWNRYRGRPAALKQLG